LRYLAKHMKPGLWLYPEDQITDMPMRLLAAELTREKLFRKLYDELPYGLTVETENWEERDDGSAMVHQVVFLERDAHKPIVLGKGGSLIKMVGTESRTELEELTDRRIHLKIFVKVRENWQEDPSHYESWGLEFNS
jgi:GTPase